MSGERSLAELSIALLVGINLIMLSASPIVDSSVKTQVQTYQILLLILTAVTVTMIGAIAAAKKRLQQKC